MRLQIYRDMRHPYKYPQAVKVTFSFAVSHPSSRRPRCHMRHIGTAWLTGPADSTSSTP